MPMHDASIPPVRKIERIPLTLPYERILSRLGYNRHLTMLQEHQRVVIDKAMQTGFSLCEIRGMYARVPIRRIDDESIELAGARRLCSRSLADFVASADELLLMMCTVGAPLMDAIQESIRRRNSVWAAVLDATGSETADAGVGWIQDYVAQTLTREGLRVTRMRYSPGYGDLLLETQKTIDEILHFRDFGVTVTPRFQLVPEKSVTAIAGIGADVE